MSDLEKLVNTQRVSDNFKSEDKGYTYGIHSYLQNMIEQSAWMVSTEAGKDVCAATIAEVYKEMARLIIDLSPKPGTYF